MIKLLIDLLEFLRDCAPLLFSVCVLTLLSVLFAKSIRKHATVYYIIFSIPFILAVVPFLGRLFGVEIFNFDQIPFLGAFTRDYIHMATFGHPLLIIIMYTGALDPKMQFAKKLYSIRKELSIISGFPVLTHSLFRVTYTFPKALKFFTNHADYMANAKVTSELGSGFSNFSFVLGILLLVIFIPLWITSFDSVHRRMGNVKWKKLQKWAYVLYAILFIHAMGMQIGGLISYRGRNASPQQQVIAKDSDSSKKTIESKEVVDRSSQANRDSKPSTGERPNRTLQSKGDKENRQAQTINSFTDINVSSEVKRYIKIFSLLLIYGSYLFLKIRKERKKKAKKRFFVFHK